MSKIFFCFNISFTMTDIIEIQSEMKAAKFVLKSFSRYSDQQERKDYWEANSIMFRAWTPILVSRKASWWMSWTSCWIYWTSCWMLWTSSKLKRIYCWRRRIFVGSTTRWSIYLWVSKPAITRFFLVGAERENCRSVGLYRYALRYATSWYMFQLSTVSICADIAYSQLIGLDSS